MEKCLVVMAKVPEIGEVKTRFVSWLGEEGAYELYKCLLIDRLRNISALPTLKIYLACFPYERKSLLGGTIPQDLLKNIEIIPQEGRDLGERMVSVLRQFDFKKQNIALIDTDTPGLTEEIIKTGFQKIENSEIVIGPTLDGGYYFIGLSLYLGDIFKDIPWGGNDVFSGTIKKIRKQGLSFKILPELMDIDTKEDAEKFFSSENTGIYPKTATFLKKYLK